MQTKIYNKVILIFTILLEIARLTRLKREFHLICRNRLVYQVDVDVTSKEKEILADYGIDDINATLTDSLRMNIRLFQRDFITHTDRQITFLKDTIDSYLEAVIDGDADIDYEEFIDETDVIDALRQLLSAVCAKPELADNVQDGIFDELPSDVYKLWKGCTGHEQRNAIFVFD